MCFVLLFIQREVRDNHTLLPLKKLLAEKELDIDMLKEVSRGNF
jgi:hypothetical protein